MTSLVKKVLYQSNFYVRFLISQRLVGIKSFHLEAMNIYFLLHGMIGRDTKLNIKFTDCIAALSAHISFIGLSFSLMHRDQNSRRVN